MRRTERQPKLRKEFFIARLRNPVIHKKKKLALSGPWTT